MTLGNGAIVPGMRLRHRATGDEAWVSKTEYHASGTWVTIKGPTIRGGRGYMLAALVKVWEPRDVSPGAEA